MRKPIRALRGEFRGPSAHVRKTLPIPWRTALLTLLLPLAANTQTTASCDFSGIWYDPQRAGEGYTVFANASGLMVYFLGFDNWGSNFWVTSELVHPGRLKFGETVLLPMLITPMQQGGEFDQPLPPDLLEHWGRLEVNFDSCISAVFTLDAYDRWNFGYKVSYVEKLMGPDTAGEVELK